MSRWLYFHKNTLKKLRAALIVVFLLIYGVFVWNINYLFKKNYHNDGYRDVALNEPFECRGEEIIIRDYKALTAEQVIEQYGNPESYAYDMEGNLVMMDSINPECTYVIVYYDRKKLVESPEFDKDDFILCDTFTNGYIEPHFQELLLGDNAIFMKDVKVGEPVKNRVMGFCLSNYYMEKEYVKDPSKDKYYLVFPSDSIDEKPIRIKLN